MQAVIDNISVARWTTNFSHQPRDLIIHYAHRFYTLWSSCVWPSPSPQFSRIKIETTKIKIATFTHQHILTINDKEAEPKIKVEKFHSCRLGRDNKKFRRPSPPIAPPFPQRYQPRSADQQSTTFCLLENIFFLKRDILFWNKPCILYMMFDLADPLRIRDQINKEGFLVFTSVQ